MSAFLCMLESQVLIFLGMWVVDYLSFEGPQNFGCNLEHILEEVDSVSHLWQTCVAVSARTHGLPHLARLGLALTNACGAGTFCSKRKEAECKPAGEHPTFLDGPASVDTHELIFFHRLWHPFDVLFSESSQVCFSAFLGFPVVGTPTGVSLDVWVWVFWRGVLII